MGRVWGEGCSHERKKGGLRMRTKRRGDWIERGRGKGGGMKWQWGKNGKLWVGKRIKIGRDGIIRLKVFWAAKKTSIHSNAVLVAGFWAIKISGAFSFIHAFLLLKEVSRKTRSAKIRKTKRGRKSCQKRSACSWQNFNDEADGV